MVDSGAPTIFKVSESKYRIIGIFMSRDATDLEIGSCCSAPWFNSKRPCILVKFPNGDFTHVEWGAADRSAPGRQRPLSSKGRRTISKQSPNGCPGRVSPHLARKGQCFT